MKNFRAFTLAEVLITLAVVGVVAILTIPNLVRQYQQRQWDVAADVFVHKINEVTKIMNTQQVLAGYSTTQAFVSELSKYMKIIKVCDNTNLSDCFPNEFYWGNTGFEPKLIRTEVLKTSGSLGHKGWSTEAVGLQFADGSAAIIAYNGNCVPQDPYSNQIVGTECLSILYNTSGFSPPNEKGKDLRGVNVLLSTCDYNFNGACYTSTFHPSLITQAECEKVSGVNKCILPKENWASAVKICSDMKMRLPTKQELADIASYVYFGELGKVPAEGYQSGTFDADRARETPALLGLGYYTSFEEADGKRAYFRGLLDTGTNVLTGGANRYDNSKRAFCVE